MNDDLKKRLLATPMILLYLGCAFVLIAPLYGDEWAGGCYIAALALYVAAALAAAFND